MAVASDFQKLKSELKCSMYELDAEGPSDVAWVDMRGYDRILIGVMRSVGTGGLDDFRIIANPASDGSGADVEVKDYGSGKSTVDAVGDYVWLEASAEEIRQAAKDAGVADVRYVSASLGHVTATDESVLVYVLGDADHKYKNQTADNIA